MMVVPDKKYISQKVENHIIKNESRSYIDAVLYICEKEEIDPEVVGKFLSKPIKEKLETEARRLNLIRNKKPKLPL